MEKKKLEWKKLKESKIRAGHHRILVNKTFRLPDGRVAEYEILKRLGIVCIFALTPKNRVILVRQYRPGAEMVLDEMPGGNMDEGETPMRAAKRELLEETGYTGKIKLVGWSFDDDAYAETRRYHLIATNCKKVAEPKPDKNEFLEVVEVSLGEFRKHLKSRKLTDVKVGYLCLDFLNLL